jgi:hypothetical protein
MSISMKTILAIPAFQVSKTISAPGLGHPTYPTVSRRRIFRGLIVPLFGFLLLFTFSMRSLAIDDLYQWVTGQGGSIDTPPPGPGWQQVAGTDANGNPVEGRVKVPAHGQLTLSRPNEFVENKHKHWLLSLEGANVGNAAAVKDLTGKTDPTGYDNKGKALKGDDCKPATPKTPFDQNTNIRNLQYNFYPQPAWERATIQNPTGADIFFNVVKNETKCDSHASTLLAMVLPGTGQPGTAVAIAVTGMCSFPGSRNPELIDELAFLPEDNDIDTNTLGTANMPASTIWQVSYANEYAGMSAPHGAVIFTCVSGGGLTNGQIYNLAVAMLGQADTHYTEVTHDSIAQQYATMDVDLAPTIFISTGSNNLASLEFNSTLGFNYSLLGSPSLSTSQWQPFQGFVGTGNDIASQVPMTGSSGFFRVACQPAPPVINPPSVIGVSAPANSNAITITFSEPVDPMTATDPNNYFTGGFFGPILIDNVSPLGSRAVVLTLGSPLMLSSNYFLGVRGVADLNGNVMAPTSSQFSPFALQAPCPGGTQLARQTYSVCEPDGFWHVVEDDWYDCPPVTKFRVADTKTDQPCNSAQTPPNPVGLLYCTSADVVSTCQSYNTVGPVTVCTGNGGLWQASSYIQDQCLDGTLYLDGPIQTVPMNPPTSYGQTPPFSPAPQ